MKNIMQFKYQETGQETTKKRKKVSYKKDYLWAMPTHWYKW